MISARSVSSRTEMDLALFSASSSISARRSCFQVFRVTAGDRLLLVMMLALLAAVLGTATLGGMAADFIPQLSFAPISGGYAWGFLAYCSYLLIPTVLHFREALQWHILRSRI